MATKQSLLILAAIALMIGGCSHKMSMQDDFGDSVKTNIAKQTINPEAGKEQVAPATLDGQKAEQSLKTYRKDKGKASSERLVTDMVN